MKPLLIAACIAGFSVLPQVSWGQQACQVTVRARVEVASGEFSLADLLARDTCPALLRAAARVPLGNAPLAGSVRVFEAGEVRTLLRKVAEGMHRSPGPTNWRVPKRVTVRRAGARASCAGIGARILASLITRPAVDGSRLPDPARPAAAAVAPHDVVPDVVPRDIECGGADRIPGGAQVELTRTVWAPALNSWEISLRCIHPTDCVPFLVRVRNHTSSLEMATSAGPVRSATAQRATSSSAPFGREAPNLASAQPLVRPGEAVTLLWDQDGIRLVVPAICLDPGGAGQSVRARIAPRGRLVRAIVVSAGELRMSS